MSWLMASVYDRFMRATERACLQDWRGELLRDLSGDVLEIGAGTGANLAHYPRAVARLVLTDPDRFMFAIVHHRPTAERVPVGRAFYQRNDSVFSTVSRHEV